MQKIRTIGFFFENTQHWLFKVEKQSTNGNFRPHIYLRTNKALIHLEFGNSLSNVGTPFGCYYLRYVLPSKPFHRA
jgi:hypothetical protein